MKIAIAYYTGTGGTERAAKLFAASFALQGAESELFWIRRSPDGGLPPLIDQEADRTVVLFPVHSLNAPALVFEWLNQAGEALQQKAAVISVSGGGAMFPNNACRFEVIRELEAKGFDVTYEAMLVLPPNCLIRTPEEVSAALLAILPQKVEEISEDLVAGKTCRQRPGALEKTLAHWGRSYEKGAKKFGSHIRVGESCTRCGICIEHCPTSNILLAEEGVRFLDRCHACLSCVYRCPNQALHPTAWKSVVLKEGYRLEDWDHPTPPIDGPGVDKLIKGLIWLGVRRYLHMRTKG